MANILTNYTGCKEKLVKKMYILGVGRKNLLTIALPRSDKNRSCVLVFDKFPYSHFAGSVKDQITAVCGKTEFGGIFVDYENSLLLNNHMPRLQLC